MIVFITFVIIIIIVYIKTVRHHKYRYWDERKVRYVKPLPVFGYMAPNVLSLKSFAETVQALYNTFPEQRYFGCFQFITPVLMVRNPELIERILVTDSDKYFSQRKNFRGGDTDPIWDKSLFFMKDGEEYREARCLMSSILTSNMLKDMLGIMKERAKKAIGHLQKTKTLPEIDIKNVASRFTNDVITSAVFGIDNDSFEDPKSQFYCFAEDIRNRSGIMRFGFFLCTFWPRLANLRNFRVFENKHITFYTNIIKEAIRDHVEKNIMRTDFIGLLIEARKNVFSNKSFTNEDHLSVAMAECAKSKQENPDTAVEDIPPQITTFLLDGYESVSTAISHVLYELALNQHIQQKLRNEVDSVDKDITFDKIQDLKYLDMVVLETLRKWPFISVLIRECTETTTIPCERAWENEFTIDANTICAVPVFAIHRDPKLYPNPNKFDPERFNDENKCKIQPFTYLPFGLGPRNCVGSQFAFLEIKTFIFFIVATFEIVRSKKTKENPKFISNISELVITDARWVGLKPRNTEDINDHHQKHMSLEINMDHQISHM